MFDHLLIVIAFLLKALAHAEERDMFCAVPPYSDGKYKAVFSALLIII